MCPIVEFIARHPGMAGRLLVQHGDDGDGRCRVCSAGAQTGRQVWPCQIHGYAARADEVERRRADDRRRFT